MIFLSQSTWRWLDPVKQAIFQAIFISTHGCYRAGATASASGLLALEWASLEAARPVDQICVGIWRKGAR